MVKIEKKMVGMITLTLLTITWKCIFQIYSVPLATFLNKIAIAVSSVFFFFFFYRPCTVVNRLRAKALEFKNLGSNLSSVSYQWGEFG